MSTLFRSIFLLGCVTCASGCQSKREAAQQPEQVAATRQLLLSEAQVPSSARARFFAPSGAAAFRQSTRIDTDIVEFDYLVLADTASSTIRRVELKTGLATTIAGVAGQEGSSGSLFRKPTAVAIGGEPPEIFVADTGNHTLRRIHTDPESQAQVVDTLAGSAGQRGYEDSGRALFDSPQGVAIAKVSHQPFSGIRIDAIFVADTGNAVIRRIRVADGQVDLVAGQPGQHGFADASVGSSARFNRPTGLALAGNNKLYVADTGNHVVRVIDVGPSGNGAVTTLAGSPTAYGYRDGAPGQALFAQPMGLAIKGDVLLVADRASYTIREVDIKPGALAPMVRTLAGVAWEKGFRDGDAAFGRFRAPSSLSVLGNVIYVADTGNNLVRTVRTENGALTSTLSGARSAGSSDGWPEAFSIGKPKTLACEGNRLFSDGGQGVQVIELDVGATSGAARTVASSDWNGFVQRGNALYRNLTYNFERLDLGTGERSAFTSVDNTDSDTNVAIVATDTAVFVKFDAFFSQTSPVRKFDLEAGSPRPGVFSDLPDSFMAQLPVWDGSHIYSRLPGKLRKSDPNGSPPITTDIPVDLGADSVLGLAVKDGFAYVTTSGAAPDANRHTIRRITLATGQVTVLVAGSGALQEPHGLCVSDGALFVADTGHGAIGKVDLTTGEVVALSLRRAE